MSKMNEQGCHKVKKLALTILGLGVVTGLAMAYGVDKVTKKIFVNEDWPDGNWTEGDWIVDDWEY